MKTKTSTDEHPRPPPDAKPCRICNEKIHDLARKCVHCDSWQDWRGNLGISTEILALLVALVSVATAAMPVIVKTFTPDNSDLHFSFQGMSVDTFSVMVSNSGVRAGTVNSAAIVLNRDQNHERIVFDVSGLKNSAAVLIEPGTTKLLNYGPSIVVFGRVNQPLSCGLEISHTDFRGVDRQYKGVVECERIRYLADNN